MAQAIEGIHYVRCLVCAEATPDIRTKFCYECFELIKHMHRLSERQVQTAWRIVAESKGRK